MIVDTIRQDPREIAVHHKRNSTSSGFLFLSLFHNFFFPFGLEQLDECFTYVVHKTQQTTTCEETLGEAFFFFFFCTLGTNVEGVSLWKSVSPTSTSREFSLGQRPKLAGVQATCGE